MKKFSLRSTAMALAMLLLVGNSAIKLSGEASALEAAEASSGAAAVETVSEDARLLMEAGTPPAYYSSEEEGYVTQPKDQWEDTTCWLFTGVSLMETAILMDSELSDSLNGSIDLSEEQIKCAMLNKLSGQTNEFGTRDHFNAGGNIDIFCAAVMQGVSVVNEGGKYPAGYHLGPYTANASTFYDSTDPLPTLGQAVLKPDYNLLKTHWIYDKGVLEYSNSSHTAVTTTLTAAERKELVTEMKQAIMDYGAVSCSIRSTPLESGNNCFLYCKDATVANISNHSVVIVGWDDSVSKSYFSPSPTSDGAFLCKNSWGTDRWGKAVNSAYDSYSFNIDWPDGYFWLSYEDINCGSYCAAVCDVDAAHPDQYVYQNDKYAPANFAYDEGDISSQTIAVKYDRRELVERLDSITFLSQNVGTEYTVWLATAESEPADPTTYLNDCEKIEIARGTTDNCGYYTIDLSGTNQVLTDPIFYIIIYINNAYPFACEGIEATAEPSENFVFSTNSGWREASVKVNGTVIKTTHALKVRTVELKETLVLPVTLLSSKNNPDGASATVTVTDQQGNQLLEKVITTRTGSEMALLLDDSLTKGLKVDISITRPGYTTAVLNDFVVGGPIPGNVRMYSGDLNNSGTVNPLDLSMMVYAINNRFDPADPQYAHYDLDGKSGINPLDLSILIYNLIEQRTDNAK